MAVTEPPVCIPCVRVATHTCPALRRGAAAIRVRHYPIFGVRGRLYRSDGPTPTATGEATIPYDDAGAIRWTVASNLTRELHDCTIIPLEDLCQSPITT